MNPFINLDYDRDKPDEATQVLPTDHSGSVTVSDVSGLAGSESA